MLFGILQWTFVLVALESTSGERWRWPDDTEGAESVRIDDKVGFVDGQTHRSGKSNSRGNVQADEVSFQEPTDTDGFYNRPPGSGRYPVRVEPARFDDKEIRINGRSVYNGDNRNANQRYQTDGTLDSLQYCKCVSTPNCQIRAAYSNACGANQYLCCYNIPNKENSIQSEYFNEVDDKRPMLFPDQSDKAGPFLRNRPILVGPGGQTGVGGPSGFSRPSQNPEILVGPEGPTGVIGVPKNQVLVGPKGPTGIIGPNKPVLVGPQGPTGIVGPGNEDRNEDLLVRPLNSPTDIGHSETAQRGVLVGPGGPTGIIGPAFNRPLLVGPGGPSGIVGPSFNRPILVGPGGPTGIIGPSGFGRPSQSPGILVGPGGPTGIIGPGRRILVGPGGPTGRIGPGNFFGK